MAYQCISEIKNLVNPETARLMAEHEIDQDVAEKAQELIDDGLDEEGAI